MLAVVALCLSLAAQPAPTVTDFSNVLLPAGADPWVARGDDGTYYLLITTAQNITLRRAPTLAGLGAGEAKVVWTPPADGPYSKSLWAPELHRLDGKWYVYFAADDGRNETHRLYVLENPGPDPFAGEFTFKGRIADPAADKWAIDATILTVRGKRYLVWSGWAGDTDVRQDLYIAPLRNPWTLAGPRVKLTEPEHAWEKVGAPPAVMEGPQALVRGDAVHLVYSASGSWTDAHCMGRLTLRPGGDPLDPAAWTKHPEPVFRSAVGATAPGHCCFAKSPDGREDWLLYHTARFPGAGWRRQVRLQRFDWAADGTPAFREPVTGEVPLPGGEPARRRFPVVGHRATLTVPAAGEYAVAFRYRTPADDAAEDEAVKVFFQAAGSRGRGFAVGVPTRGRWSVAHARLALRAGDTRLTLTGPEVASVDVWRP
jgi:GH43 family beta-xylosidase